MQGLQRPDHPGPSSHGVVHRMPRSTRIIRIGGILLVMLLSMALDTVLVMALDTATGLPSLEPEE